MAIQNTNGLDSDRHGGLYRLSGVQDFRSLAMVSATVIDGDLLDQPAEVIVNAWNRNIIPWWLLLPQGVSGAIKKRGGYQAFFDRVD